MTTAAATHKTVDCRGLACPMPIVRTRKAMDELPVGESLEVLATDKGAPTDFKAWAERTEQKFLGVEEKDGVYHIRIKKVAADTKEKERLFSHEMTNEELQQRVTEAGRAPIVLDVREPGEYAGGRIPGARHIPVEALEEHITGLDPNEEYAVVCRTGRRSDYACQVLEKHGFTKVKNVVPGMTEWKGPIEKE